VTVDLAGTTRGAWQLLPTPSWFDAITQGWFCPNFQKASPKTRTNGALELFDGKDLVIT